MLRPGVRGDAAWLGRLEPDICRRTCGGTLTLDVTSTSPCNQGPAHGQKGSGVLDHRGQRSEGAHDDEIACGAAVGPFLDARIEYLDRREAGGCHRPLEERGAAGVRLDERDPSARQCSRKREAGEAGAGPHIGDRASPADLAQLERDQRIGEVDIDGLERITHRGGGEFVARQQVEEREERRCGCVGQVISVRQAVDRRGRATSRAATPSGRRTASHGSARCRTRAM